MSTKLKTQKDAFSAHKDVKLTVVAGVNKGKKYRLGGKVVSLGRSPENDIELINVKISKKHARFEVHGNKILLTDLGSGNGTFVNGKRVKSIYLSPGDQISFGGVSTIKIDGTFVFGKKENPEDVLGELLSDAKKIDKELEGQSLLEKVPEEEIKGKGKSGFSKVFLILILFAGAGYLVYDFYMVPKEKTVTKKKPESIINKVKGIDPHRQSSFEDKVDMAPIYKTGLTSSQREANRLYIKAYQAYLSNRFNDSIRMFKEVLLFDRNHVLAHMYLERAQEELAGLIDTYDVEGRYLYNNLKYHQAIIKFRAVMNLLEGSKQDIRYRDAKQFIKMAQEKMMGY